MTSSKDAGNPPGITDGSGRDQDDGASARWRSWSEEPATHHQRRRSRRSDLSGRPFAFEILVPEPHAGTAFADLCVDSLRRIGIYANIRLGLMRCSTSAAAKNSISRHAVIAAWIASRVAAGYGQAAASSGVLQRRQIKRRLTTSPARAHLRSDAMIAVTWSVPAKTHGQFVDAVRAYDRVLLSGFYIVPLFYAREQWIAYSNKLAHPKYIPLFGVTIDNWWEKQP